MGIFDRFRRAPPRTTEDVLFGTLIFRDGTWNGEFVLQATGARILLGIEAQAIDVRHRDLIRELDRRYEQIAPSIAGELLRLYGGATAGPVAVWSAEGMQSLTVLGSVDLLADGSIRLGYAFNDDVEWPDAMFSVELLDWRPVDGFFAD